MLASWLQSWRLSSWKTRLQAILNVPENMRPSIMLYTAADVSSREGKKNIILVKFGKL